MRYLLAEVIIFFWFFMPRRLKCWAFLNARPFPGEEEILREKINELEGAVQGTKRS